MNELLKNIEFTQDENNHHLLMNMNGVIYNNVHPAMLFPLTETNLWISIQSEDGREIICIEDPKKLSETSYIVLMEALGRRHFVPSIEFIHSISHHANGHEWNVTTDHGHTVFDVETDESIQSLGHGRMVVIDRRNTRYLIPNVASLDSESRHKLEQYY